MVNVTYIPCDALKPYIQSFVISETPEEKTYNVLPNTGLVIGFQYKGSLSFIDNREISLASSGVTGIRDRVRVFKNSADIGTVLVFFKEGGAAPFFNQPLHEIFSESLSMENFMLRSELLLFEEQLREAKTNTERITVVERFLISRMRPYEEDKLVLAALSVIHKNKGNIRIKELADQLHISQSPLEKRFRRVIGASPKKFASIVRLQYTIANHRAHTALTEVGYEAGFYDQAHFIKEFKNFTGQTPQSFFNTKK